MTVDAAPRARLAFGALQLAARADQDGPVLFSASTTALNRYGFRLRHEGWRIGNYLRNPIVAWNHDTSRPPIGRADAALDGFARELRAAVTFDRGDPFAADIERKVRGGFLNAVSVGWDFVDAAGAPISDWWRMSAQQAEREAFYDLAEISVTPVPGDPGAVRAGQSLGAAGAVTADGCATLLGALRLDPDPVTAAVHQVLGEALAERAGRRRAILDAFPTPDYLAPIVGGR
jgi:hypothetical protein